MKGTWIAVVVGFLALAGRADAGEWRGSWRVDGTTSWRHLGGPDDRLILEGRIAGLDASLEGAGGERGFTLTGTIAGAQSEQERYAERPARLVARADGETLDVTLTIEGAPPVRERWRRPSAPKLRVEVRGRAVESMQLGAEGELAFDVVIEGRPMPVMVQVLAQDDDARYAGLGGVVEQVTLALGEALPVGRHRFTWSGIDRSLRAARVLPGRYRVVVATTEDALGPAPGEPPGQLVAEVELVVEGTAPPSPLPGPGPEDEGPGLTSALTRRAAPAARR